MSLSLPRHHLVRLGLLLAMTSFSAPSGAASNWAVSLDAGSTGVGAGLVLGLGPQMNLRAAWRGLNVDYDQEATDNNGIQGDEADYHGDLLVRGGHLLLDYYPGGGHFYLSAGGMVNGSKVSADAYCSRQSRSGCELGDSAIARLAPGDTIHYEYMARDLAPYVGIGIGNALGGNKDISVQADLGVLYLGKPDLELTYTGTCNGTVAAAECQRQVEQEEQELEREYADYQFYPVINISVAYRF